QLLTKYFEGVMVSDIARTGRDNYREFNESMSVLQRMLIRGRPKGYAFHSKLKETLMELIRHRFRDAETGWWGPSYVRDGKTVFIDDLSITFHTVSYFKGDVSDLAKVVQTALAVKDL